MSLGLTLRFTLMLPQVSARLWRWLVCESLRSMSHAPHRLLVNVDGLRKQLRIASLLAQLGRELNVVARHLCISLFWQFIHGYVTVERTAAAPCRGLRASQTIDDAWGTLSLSRSVSVCTKR